MQELPSCDFCKQEGRDPVEPAEYDAKTILGPHAYMCQEHFEKYGTSLGTKLVLPTKQADETIAKADDLCRQCGRNCPEKSWNKTEGRFRLLDKPDTIWLMLETGSSCDEAMDIG